MRVFNVGLSLCEAIQASAAEYNERRQAAINRSEAGERPARLLNSSAGDEAAEVDGREAKAFDQVFHGALGFFVITRDEDHAPGLALDRSLVEAGHANGIERLDDARPWREASHDLACPDTAKELGAGLGKGVGGVYEDTTVPLG
jgi:hypothetical protein